MLIANIYREMKIIAYLKSLIFHHSPINEETIIYSNRAYRGAIVPDSVKKRKANANFMLEDLNLWEHDKSMNDTLVSRWVNEKLVPKLKSKKTLNPIVVWQNNGKNYVIDGHHRIFAYKKMEWKGPIKAILLKESEVKVTDWVGY